MKIALQKRFQKLLTNRRDPRYVFVILWSSLLFIITYLQVRSEGLFDSIEKPVFYFFNSLPEYLFGIMYAITQFGGMGSLLLWMAFAWYMVRRRSAFTVLGAGVLAWTIAKLVKVSAERGRPQDFINDINFFGGETLGGFGFPSGHATLAAACAAVLYYEVPSRYRKYLLLLVLGVGVSRMYLGAHFPLDIVGGWALGAFLGAGLSLVFGISSKDISVMKLKRFLKTRGIEVKTLQFADVDARGSRPIFIQTTDRKQYFAKLFGKQEHAADWLFKIFRFFRYKNLQAEEPHISSRRNVEIEAFGMLWAQQAGVRVAKVKEILKYGTYWLSIQEKVDAIPLSDHKRLQQKSLEDAWKQVSKLHAANIAHRDLRAANIMIDKKGQAWIIDFGFAEISAAKQRQYMDNAELLMSMSLVVGVERTIKAAKKYIDKDVLKRTLPYLQTAVFSGATTKLLKSNKHLLTEMKDSLQKLLKIDEVEEVGLIRINKRKVLNLFAFAIFIYVIAPQLSTFREAFGDTKIVNFIWIVPLVAASIATYVLTGIIYVSLSSVPLRVRDAALVQLAASFVSKIVPGGIGGTALNAKYLKKSGLDLLETSAVISLQAIIGFVMFMVPLSLFLLFNGTNIIKLIDINISKGLVVAVISAVLLAGVTVFIVPRIRHMLQHKIAQGVESVREISTPPRETFFAAISSLSVTFAYVACLYFALLSVGVTLGVGQAILVYATAVIAKSAVPVPGGLGPVEAAMIAVLLGFGVDKAQALSAVLVYRLATFWIPIPFSLYAYKLISARKLI